MWLSKLAGHSPLSTPCQDKSHAKPKGEGQTRARQL